MKKIESVTKVHDGRFIKTFVAKYKVGSRIKEYEIASRKDEPDIVSGKCRPDAVRILPFLYEGGKLKVVLIKEFRYAINKYIYAVPAGLVDGNEDPLESAKRELREEIGAKVKRIFQTEKCSYSSPGFSDESIICYEAEVELGDSQKLDGFEDISILKVDLKKLENMLDNEDFGLQSRLQLRAFLFKHQK